MKKLHIVLAVLMSFGVMKVYAEEIRNVPGSGNNTSIPADYGGVDIATNSFFVGLATAPSENGPQFYGYRKFYTSTTSVNGVFSQTRWTIYGVNWSTGACSPTDFISIQVSSSGASQARELTRFYNNVSIATAAATTNGSNLCGGMNFSRWPIRAYGNLFWGVNVGLGGGSVGGGPATANPYNRADLLYYRESE